MIRVIAKRDFISTVFGNVSPGKILTVSEAQGKFFVEHGLAERIISAGPADVKPEVKAPGFTQPIPGTRELGSSLPAGQASPSKTVKPSGNGGKKKRQKKDLSR